VEFSIPAVRIVKSSLSGSTMMVEIEFINPENRDHSMKATISSAYSFINAQNLRQNDFAQNRITQSVKAGDSVTQLVSLSLNGGSDVIADEPVVIDVMIN
jgi:hypothetical protein